MPITLFSLQSVATSLILNEGKNSPTIADLEINFVDDGCHEYKNKLEQQEQAATNDIPELIPFGANKEAITFEKIAHLVAGVFQPIYSAWDTLDTMFISNKQLALSIAKDECDHVEEYKLKTILSSAQKCQQFFNDLDVQIILLQAYFDGVEMDSRILAGLRDCTPKLPPDDQGKLAVQLLALLSASSDFFGKITILFRFFATLPTESKTKIARAIRLGEFVTNLVVLKAVAENLTIFTDLEAQKEIAAAIDLGEFGTDSAVLQAVARNLSIFTYSEAQKDIAWAIVSGKFGTNLAVLQAVAQNLTIFTDPKAQQIIANAIDEQKFVTHSALIQVVAENLSIFTDSEAQKQIACAIVTGQFGTDPVVLQAVAKNLMIFTDSIAQKGIALAIRRRRFGTDSAVLQAILRSVPGLLDTQTIIEMIRSLNTEFPEKIAILRGRKLSLESNLPNILSSPEQDFTSLFGAKVYSGTEVTSLLRTRFSTMSHDAIDSVCNDTDDYVLQINDQQLILYPLTSHRDKADFMGWMSPEHGVFYKQCITRIKIFDFSLLQHGYPTIITGENLSPTHTIFASLPRYLQVAILDNSFNLSEFRYHKIIKFVTDTLMAPLIADNPILGGRMQAIMQSSIAAQGDGIRIGLTEAEDAATKDELNVFCDTRSNRVSSTAKLHAFLLDLPDVNHKARLAILLGTMAKKGVLGYHHEGKNQAHQLLYLLASDCFHQLQGAAGIVFPENFHRNLNEGVCMEQLINHFINANAFRTPNCTNPQDFSDVFFKK